MGAFDAPTPEHSQNIRLHGSTQAIVVPARPPLSGAMGRHEKSPAPKCGGQVALRRSVQRITCTKPPSLAQVRAPGEAVAGPGLQCRHCRLVFHCRRIAATRPMTQRAIRRPSELKRWRKQSCPRHLQFPLHTYYGVSPYIAFSWPWAKARAGGISILPPMISM